ncbi:ATPase [Salinimicrobium marinum]|uniref:ATPase n=1 Tax=Salinimicrobium marinum TaxID=680283 RepID=A0A918SBK3_9FLAO|nr:ATP-binding protein [Salinimicrobium marinum]GHA33073.1 ATPase [Salinimicrobium marinum]
MKKKKIVITGGPGTGKTSIIKVLEENGYHCLHEISRQITLQAQKEGIDQLFLAQPLLFSQKLLEGRIQQHAEADNFDSEVVFIDRGVPDVVAYMDYFGNEYPPLFREACEQYSYDAVFLLPPWKEIYVSDNERYESFEQAVSIHDHLEDNYKKSGYNPIEVPTGSVEERFSFIIDHLS